MSRQRECVVRNSGFDPRSARSRAAGRVPCRARRRHFRIVAGPRRDYFQPGNAPFWAVHLAALAGVVYLGLSWAGVALALGAYFVRMFAVTAGYHRYFSHRAFKTSRAFQFVLAVLAQTLGAEGRALVGRATTATITSTPTPPQDVHSPRAHGLLVLARRLDPRRRLGRDRPGADRGLRAATPSCVC